MNKSLANLDLISGGLRIGYARVSTSEQNLDGQLDALKAAGCAAIYQEKASGSKSAARPELANAIKASRSGDTLVVWRLDRLGRSLGHLVKLTDELRDRGVHFESLHEKIDNSTTMGLTFMHLMSVLAEFELNLIRERTAAGVAAARARGRKGGRPASLSEEDKRRVRALLSDPKVTVVSVAKLLNVSRSTIYNNVGSIAPKPESEQ